MLQNLLFTMSLTGTVVFLLYILLYPLAKRYFSLRWRYSVLKLAVVFYLVPFPEWKYRFLNVIYAVIPDLWEKFPKISSVVDTKYAFIIGNSGIWLSSQVKIMFLSILFSGIISLVVIVRHVFLYEKLKKIYFSSSEDFIDKEGGKRFLEWKRKLNIKRKIVFINSKYCRSPMVCGQWPLVVLFPILEETKLDINDYDALMKHELVHIKHHDLLIKYMGLLVVAIHWFNPFSYFLLHELSCISEMYCDETVLEGEGEESRCKYGELLLKLAAGEVFSNSEKFFVGAANSQNKKEYKRRILEMKRKRGSKALLSAITMVLVCMAGGMTCFAYNPPTAVLDDGEYQADEDFSFITETDDIEESLPYDNFFVDEEGNIYDTGDESDNSRASCSHIFSVDGIFTRHAPDGKGGCTLRKYDSLKCKFCNTIKVGDLISTTTYTTCPH